MLLLARKEKKELWLVLKVIVAILRMRNGINNTLQSMNGIMERRCPNQSCIMKNSSKNPDNNRGSDENNKGHHPDEVHHGRYLHQHRRRIIKQCSLSRCRGNGSQCLEGECLNQCTAEAVVVVEINANSSNSGLLQ